MQNSIMGHAGVDGVCPVGLKTSVKEVRVSPTRLLIMEIIMAVEDIHHNLLDVRWYRGDVLYFDSWNALL